MLTAVDPKTPVPAGHVRLYAFYQGQLGAEDFIGCTDVAEEEYENDDAEARGKVEELFKDEGGFWGINVMTRDEVVCNFNTYADALGQPNVEGE